MGSWRSKPLSCIQFLASTNHGLQILEAVLSLDSSFQKQTRLNGDLLPARITSSVANWPVAAIARAVSTAVSGSITTAIIGAEHTAVALSTAVATGAAVVVTTHVVKGGGFRWTARGCS